MSDGGAPAGRGWDWLVEKAGDLESWNSDVVKTIHGYDAAVIWKGARASSS